MLTLEFYQKKFHTYLYQYIQSLHHQSPAELYQPIQYILNTEAKHIRPILCLIGAHLYQNNIHKTLHAALAIELFHTFSLIHDDILDNSTIRRGKKTIHNKWNTNIAILSGDVLLVEAYKILTKYTDKQSYHLYKVFTQTSKEICEGQQEDMNFEHLNKISSQQYLEMIRKKTAILLGAALQMGAITANAPVSEQKKLFQIGQNIGLAFQIMDDYLDTFGNTKTFGKKVGNDILYNKKTFLLTKAIEISKQKNKYKELHCILNMPPSVKKIKDMKSLYIELNIDKLALSSAEQYHQKNYQLITSLKVKNTQAKEMLIKISDNLIKRQK